MIIRYLLVKYAQGFASRIQMKQNLILPLYCLNIIFYTLTIFCTHFFPLISKAKEDNITDLFNLFIGFSNYNSDNHLKMLVHQIPSVTIMLISYVDVQIIMTRFGRKHCQFNIVTFKQNFYFYISFILTHSILILIRVNILKLGSRENSEIFLVYGFLIKLCIDWFLRPVVILILLRKNMSDFFEDFDNPNLNQSFIMKGANTFEPRQQKFLALRPFCQNARWGSSKKFLDFTDHGYPKKSFNQSKFNYFSNRLPVIIS